MFMTKDDQENMYNEILNMDGRGLSDYLNDWTPDKTWGGGGYNEINLTITSTLYGEKVFIRGDRYEYGNEDIFKAWSKWSHFIKSHFDDFIDTIQGRNIFNDIDEAKEYFVFVTCKNLGIIDKVEEYLKVVEPYSDKTKMLDIFGLLITDWS